MAITRNVLTLTLIAVLIFDSGSYFSVCANGEEPPILAGSDIYYDINPTLKWRDVSGPTNYGEEPPILTGSSIYYDVTPTLEWRAVSGPTDFTITIGNADFSTVYETGEISAGEINEEPDGWEWMEARENCSYNEECEHSYTVRNALSIGETYYWKVSGYRKPNWDSPEYTTPFSEDTFRIYDDIPGNHAPYAENGTLEVELGTVTAGTLVASDMDGNILTFSIISQPVKGTVVINNPETGDYTYTPGTGSTSTDTFTFMANDGKEDSNVATVTISSTGIEPPANLDAESGLNSVKLFWKPSTGMHLAGYNVYRSESESGSFSQINTDPVTGDYYVDKSDLTPNQTYYYYLTAVDTSGNESDPSNKASAASGGLKIFVPDARGKSGEEVTLLVSIANADDLRICGTDIFVKYDSSVLEAVEIKKTPLSAEYGWAKNLDIPDTMGAVIATATEGEPLFGEGSLFYMQFNVIGDDGDVTDLEFQTGDPKGTYIYDCRDLVNPLPLEFGIGTFTVEPSYILGDLNGNGRVESADASICLQIAVGKVDPSEEQKTAGDVSGDTHIRSNDCSLIMILATGKELGEHVPDDSAGKREVVFRSSTVNVSVPNAAVAEGLSAWVPVEISSAANVTSADIILNYNPSLVTPTGVRTTPMTENFEVEYYVAEPGQAKISLIAKQGEGISQGSGSLVEVEFTPQADAQTDSTSPLTLASVRLNDTYSRDFASSALQVEVKTANGSLTISGTSLHNAILALKVLAGMSVDGISLNLDKNGDGKVGMEDAIRLIQVAAEIKEGSETRM